MKWKWILCTLMMLSLLVGCGKQEQPHPPQDEPGAVEPLSGGNAQEMLSKMTTEEKVGQLFFVRPDALDRALSPQKREDPQAPGLTEAKGEALKTLQTYPVGGFLFFDKNLRDPEQCAALMKDLTRSAKVPLLFATNEEGGAASCIANADGFSVPKQKDMGILGASGDPAQVKDAAASIGGYLHDLGFRLTLAPVADASAAPNAFHRDPEQAAMMVSAAVEGFHTAGVGCTLKHFPGQGAAVADPQTGRLSTDRTWQEMLTSELYPFQAGMAGGADAVMVSHLTTPNAAQQGDLPASLSREMISVKLRGELRFRRVIMTDNLSAPAITEAYEPGRAAMMAFQAGADILLMPEDLPAAYDTLLTAVKEGTISPQRLDESVLRILQLKEKYDLL